MNYFEKPEDMDTGDASKLEKTLAGTGQIFSWPEPEALPDFRPNHFLRYEDSSGEIRFVIRFADTYADVPSRLLIAELQAVDESVSPANIANYLTEQNFNLMRPGPNNWPAAWTGKQPEDVAAVLEDKRM